MPSESFVTSRVSSISSSHGVCNPSKPRFSATNSLVFTDASWADDKSSYCSALCVESDLAPILVLSRNEAELISVASYAQETELCLKLATELGFI